MTALALAATPAPWSAAATTATDCTLHQLAPYIGRVKTAIARHLISEYTAAGHLVVDPFCGSGVIPLEAALAGRRVLAGDISPYGVLLTRAKLGAPLTVERALHRLKLRWRAAAGRIHHQDLRSVPAWVRSFFHPETLRPSLALRDELVEAGDWFLLACLLGILHHQRPGFLSYPSSHLVPYLRTRLFPRNTYPELYKPRSVLPRMDAKVRRAFRRTGVMPASWRVHLCNAASLPVSQPIDAVITSPPYMNELDYVRDNRLRLWFLTKEPHSAVDIAKKDRESRFRELMRATLVRLADAMSERAVFALIVGESRRGQRVIDAAAVVDELFASEPALMRFRRECMIRDLIPDVRRSRRDLRGTKAETILVYRSALRSTRA